MKSLAKFIISTLAAVIVASCASNKPSTTIKAKSSTTKTSTSSSSSSSTKSGAVTKGKASYYADKFHGRKTASGEVYDKKKLTAAHRTYAFGTVVRVINKKNGKSVDVRINDRGPFSSGRIIDLSRAAAEKISMVNDGVVDVEVRVISVP